jgi:hypothetical protein
MRWRFWRGGGWGWGWGGDLIDPATRARAEHSAWLTRAVEEGLRYPRIPIRPMEPPPPLDAVDASEDPISRASTGWSRDTNDLPQGDRGKASVAGVRPWHRGGGFAGMMGCPSGPARAERWWSLALARVDDPPPLGPSILDATDEDSGD